MQTHRHSSPQQIEVHEGLPGAGDEPVAVVAVSVLGILVTAICTLWLVSTFR